MSSCSSPIAPGAAATAADVLIQIRIPRNEADIRMSTSGLRIDVHTARLDPLQYSRLEEFDCGANS
jgi:hypothetical protein